MKTHTGITYISSKSMREGKREWETRAKCKNYINPDLSRDPRKIDCKNCLSQFSQFKKIHYRLSDHHKNSELWLAVKNPEKVTCNVCLGLIYNVKSGKLPEPHNFIKLEISTDDRTLLKKIQALERMQKKNGNNKISYTFDDLFPILKDLEIYLFERYNSGTLRAEIENIKDSLNTERQTILEEHFEV